MRSVEQTSQNVATRPQTIAKHREGGLKPASNWPQTIENHEQSHLKAASKQNMNKSPQGIKTSESGKHFRPSLKLIRMRPRTASNHCKHRQPHTSENHEQNRLKAASSVSKSSATSNIWRQSTCLDHSLLDSQSINSRPPNHSQPTKKPRLQPTSQPHPPNQPSSQPIDRPTNGPASQPASQSAQPANQPTNQPTSQPVRPTGGVRALKPTPREQATCRLPKLEPRPAPQNEVHNL